MGRSEVRLKPEGNSEFEEPQITHTHSDIALLGEFSEDVNYNLGQGSKAFLSIKLLIKYETFSLICLFKSSGFTSKSVK